MVASHHHHVVNNNNNDDATNTTSSPSPTNTATTAALQAASSTNFTLAKIEVAIYCILIIPTLFVVHLQVFKRGNNKGGWFYSASYIIVQLVGAILVLAKGEGSISTIGEILSLIGLAPLMMAVKSSISSCAKETHLDGTVLFKPALGSFYHVLVVCSAVLSAFGYSKMFNANASENAVNHAETMVKASCILFFLAWVWMILLDIVVLKSFRELQTTKKFALATTLSCPIFLVRLIYTAISDFDPTNSSFGIASTNLVIKIIMQVLPLVVILILMDLGGFFQWRDSKNYVPQEIESQNMAPVPGRMPAYSSQAPPASYYTKPY